MGVAVANNSVPVDLIGFDRGRCSKSLRIFVKRAWNVVEPSTEFQSNWHIDAICEHLEAVNRREIRNLIINIPPRHMKSLTVSVFWPTWTWIDSPQSRWLFASYADRMSIRDSLKCRNVIRSNWYQERFGDSFQLLDDQNQKTRFDNDQTGFRLATSVTGAATGEGGDFIVIDDPLKAQGALSDVARVGVNDWWDQTMSTRLNDPDTGCRVIIMQRLHEQDLVGHILDKMEIGGPGYEHLMLPAEFEPQRKCFTSIGFEDPRTEPNELLWPERFSRETVDDLKVSLGPYSAAAQLQQRAAPMGGGLFKIEWFKFWVPRGVTLPQHHTALDDGSIHFHEQVEIPGRFDSETQSWDFAFKGKNTSDFVAGHVYGKKSADVFLIDRVHERMNIVQTMDAIIALSASHPRALRKLMEDKANGPAIMQILKRKVPGMIPVQVEADKPARARAAVPYMAGGNVYFPHPLVFPWVLPMIQELLDFPFGKYDDDVDSFSQYIQQIVVGSGKKKAGGRVRG